MRDHQPPLEYLVTSSQTSLEAFELARLNHAANLRKELRQVLEEWVQSEVDARLSRWILEARRAQDGADSAESLAGEREPLRIQQLASSFLPESCAAQASRTAKQISDAPEVLAQGIPISVPELQPQHSGPLNAKDAAATLRLLEQFADSSSHPLRAAAGQDDQSDRRGVASVSRTASPASSEKSNDAAARRQNFLARKAGTYRRDLRTSSAVRTLAAMVPGRKR